MSGLLSKTFMSAEDGLVGSLIQHVTEHAGVSPTTAKLGLLLAAVTASSLLTWKLLLAAPKNMPPGPTPLPIVGNLWELEKEDQQHLGIHTMRQKYGDIMTLYLGPQRSVILSSHELMREAFMKQGKSTSGRTYSLLFDIFSNGGKGMVMADSCPRQEMQRKLSHQTLRKFINEGVMSDFVHVGFEAMCDKLATDTELNTKHMGCLIAFNILLSMCFGKRFSFEDDLFKKMLDLTMKLDEGFGDLGLIDVMPVFQYLPLTKSYQLAQDVIDNFYSYLEEMLDGHRENFDKDKLTDFTYHLLKVIEDTENDPNERNNLKLLTKEHYVWLLVDIFFAGTDTTRITLNWIWHYLAAYPDIQRKAQEEVDAVLCRDGKVTAETRESLPFVNAVIHEVIRIKPVAPSGLFHRVTQDIQLGGYNIPKDTTLIPNIWSIHHDPRYWQDPEAFRPERWLDENGMYQYQQNGFVPFSMGRRNCVGEAFVKLELHMLTTMLLQKFTLEASPGYRVNVTDTVITAGFLAPVPQKPLIAKRR